MLNWEAKTHSGRCFQVKSIKTLLFAFQPMDTAELLQAMQIMIHSQNWQGYLYFRRNFVACGGKQRAIGEMIRLLPYQVQLVYATYFNTAREVSKPVKALLRKEAAIKIASKQSKRQVVSQQWSKNNKSTDNYPLSKISLR